MGHHKPNRAVESDPDHGHSRGLPRRPEADELEQRAIRDREEVGLPQGTPEDPDAQYRAERDEIEDAGQVSPQGCFGGSPCRASQAWHAHTAAPQVRQTASA
ncbi:hypothetical protein V1460_15655 [Streptomyces sp. SCSIO 30461]|uniref:hypothetical protein n=1 Tax=Streptomyces sp. SCSIO 30461 TaxID=3118085 RepID=UPI0030CC949C